MQRWFLTVLVVAILAILCTAYVRMHPLVFNESFTGHTHCIAITIKALRMYAMDNGEQYPAHTNGYGDALLLLLTNAGFGGCLTGPGYSGKIFEAAALTNGHVPEALCGRVYVQGLSETNDPMIAVLFDKLPTPGGDHCHGFGRLTAPLGREIARLDGSTAFIPESRWPAFAREQMELLVAAGITRKESERFFDVKPK